MQQNSQNSDSLKKKSLTKVLPGNLRSAGFIPAAAFLIMLAGCATFPAQTKIEKFAKAAATSSKLVSTVYNEHVLLVDRINYEVSANSYVRNGCFSIQNEKSVLEAKCGPGIYSEKVNRSEWATRVSLINAIHKYAVALREFADSKNAPSAHSKFAALKSAIAGLASVAGATQFAPISPIVDLSLKVVDFITIQGRAVQVRAAMKVAQDPLAASVAQLKEDIKNILTAISIEQQLYRENLHSSLNTIRADARVSRLEEYHHFHNVVGSYSQLKNQVTALRGYERILNDMVAAHNELAESSNDDRALNDFVTAINLLTEAFGLEK